MRNRQSLIWVGLVLVASIVALGQMGAPKLPTQAEIGQMVEAKAYRPALRAIAQVMPRATVGANADYDKCTLLMMRGECLLQGQDGYSAGLAYEQAAQAAGSLPQNEAARAMVMLIQKSPGLTYRPRTGDMTGRSLLDAATRQKAMAALLQDELPGMEAKAAQVMKGKALPPIFAILPTLRDLHAVEVQATGEDKQTMAVAQSMADYVYGLISSEVSRVGEQVKAIQNAASSVVDWGGGNFQSINGQTRWVPAPGASGLTSEQRQVLRDAVGYLGQIADTCDHLYAMARKYEREGRRWQEEGGTARDLRSVAAAVYDNE
jgi:hypothetical protein